MSYVTESETIIVLDNGSGMCKVGFAGEDTPRCVFPSMVGSPKRVNWMVGCGNQDVYVGDEAQKHRGVLQLRYPVKHGIVTNWEDMITIWQHTFYNELRCDPKDHPIHLTEAPNNPRVNKEKMTEIMFEQFHVPAVFISMQAILSLYASGRTTGVVLDSGDGFTHVVPVFEGYHLPNAVTGMDLAGRHLTEHLKTLLAEGGHHFNTSSEMEIVQCIKEKLCFVSQNYKKDLATPSSETARKYILPDGQVITVNSARFSCPEVLFCPNLLGRECFAMHEAIQATVNLCDIDIRRMMYKNIVISGGTTMFVGLVNRLQSEMEELVVNKNVHIKVVAPASRRFAVWIGGSILSSLSTFKNVWLSKQEYEEEGVNMIHKKCPSSYFY